MYGIDDVRFRSVSRTGEKRKRECRWYGGKGSGHDVFLGGNSATTLLFRRDRRLAQWRQHHAHAHDHFVRDRVRIGPRAFADLEVEALQREVALGDAVAR